MGEGSIQAFTHPETVGKKNGMVSTVSPLWGKQRLDVNERPRQWTLGKLSWWASRTWDEFRIASKYQEAVEKPTAGPKEDEELEETLEWTRWALENDDFAVQFTPAFSTLPLVASIESPFHVAKGGRVRIYIQVPIWVRVELVSPDLKLAAAELPSTVLPKSWSGTFTEGELCYWIATSAPREVDSALCEPHLAICPVEIRNDSEEELRVENFCLRVMHLSLYGLGEQLWADEARISFKGEDEISDIEVLGVPPREASEARIVSPPRSPVETTFAARTFSRLKHFLDSG